MAAGVRDGRRGEDERGKGAVPRGDPAQPAQQRRQVRAEDAAVDVALVEDDVAQRPQERRPPLVPGQQGVVHEVGVGEDVLRVVADPAPLLRRGCPRRTSPRAARAAPVPPAGPAGRRPAPWSATGRARSPRGPRRPPPRRPPPSAPAAGSPGSCPRRCPWRRWRAGRRARARPPRRWCDQSVETPAPRRAAYTWGFTQSGQSTVRAGRAGTSWTCTRRSERRPAARRARAAAGSKPAGGAGGLRRAHLHDGMPSGCAGGLGWCREGPAPRPDRTKEHLSWICPSPAPIAAT